MLAVVENGRWEVHSTGRTPTWTKLSTTANKNDTTIQLIEAVDWEVNDELLLAATDFAPTETERRQIVAVSADKKTLTLSAPLKFQHYAKLQNFFGVNVDTRGEVGILTSNVVVEGDMTVSPGYYDPIYSPKYSRLLNFGGHTISVGNSIVRLEGVQFGPNMGQGSRLARYPVHWHHRLAAPGQYIKRSIVKDSFSRSITVHNTNFLTVEANVLFNVTGHSIYLEDGTEERNTFTRNLVVTSNPVPVSPRRELGSFHYPDCSANPPGIVLQHLDSDSAGFWITNVNNTFFGNVAVGHRFGFWVRVDLVFSEPGFSDNDGGCVGCSTYCTKAFTRVNLPTRAQGGLQFVNNVAHSNTKSGWWIKENWVPSTLERVSGFLAYKNEIGFEDYGMSNLLREYLIMVDNAVGVSVDWVRSGESYLNNSLIVGESENHGMGTAAEGVSYNNCSAVFPGTWRSFKSRGGLLLAGYKIGDGVRLCSLLNVPAHCLLCVRTPILRIPFSPTRCVTASRTVTPISTWATLDRSWDGCPTRIEPARCPPPVA